jgi:hypothetical protein
MATWVGCVQQVSRHFFLRSGIAAVKRDLASSAASAIIRPMGPGPNATNCPGSISSFFMPYGAGQRLMSAGA